MHVFSVSVVILSLVWIERGIEVYLEVCRLATGTEMASEQAVNSSLSAADIQKVHELIQFLSSSGSSAAFVATSNRELSNPARPNPRPNQSLTSQTMEPHEFTRAEHRGRSRNGGGEPPPASVEQSTVRLPGNLPRLSTETALSGPHSSRETDEGTANPVILLAS